MIPIYPGLLYISTKLYIFVSNLILRHESRSMKIVRLEFP